MVSEGVKEEEILGVCLESGLSSKSGMLLPLFVYIYCSEQRIHAASKPKFTTHFLHTCSEWI